MAIFVVVLPGLAGVLIEERWLMMAFTMVCATALLVAEATVGVIDAQTTPHAGCTISSCSRCLHYRHVAAALSDGAR